MNKEKISELLNEILTNIMLEKPENVKEFIVEQLQKVKKRQIGDQPSEFIWDFPNPVLRQEDFEAMFNAYDMMNLHYIPVAYLVDGLRAIGVPNPDTLVSTKYKEVVEEG